MAKKKTKKKTVGKIIDGKRKIEISSSTFTGVNINWDKDAMAVITSIAGGLSENANALCSTADALKANAEAYKSLCGALSSNGVHLDCMFNFQ